MINIVLFQLTGYLYFILIVAFILHIKSSMKKRKMEQEIEHQKLYTGTLKESLNALTGFKHEYFNTIQVIAGLIEIKEYDRLKAYVDKLDTEAVAIKTAETININFKKIPELYALMISKKTAAEATGIKFDISIQDDIDIGSCSIVDYCRMIGILLDNAIDATKKCKGEDRYVEFEIVKYGKKLATRIENGTNTDDIDIDKIFMQGFSTKSKPSGEGLYQIMNIIEKYKKRGCLIELDTFIENHVFTQTFRI